MTASTYERLKKIVVEQLGVDEEQVTPEASFVDDLNADSLDLVELIMSLEEEFGAEISDEDAEKIRTVQDAVDYVEDKASGDLAATSLRSDEVRRAARESAEPDRLGATRRSTRPHACYFSTGAGPQQLRPRAASRWPVQRAARVPG